MKITRARWEWKLEDLWVGVFWKHGFVTLPDGPKKMWTDVWICFIPCCPLHLTILYQVEIPFDENKEGTNDETKN